MKHIYFVFYSYKCCKCKTNLLVGSNHCCTKVIEAAGKIAFNDPEDILCITEHEDYSAVTGCTLHVAVF